MRAEITINMDNATCEGCNWRRGLIYVLRERVIAKVAEGQEEFIIMNVNGNSIGKFQIIND